MEFKLPELGEGVYEGEAVRWLVKPGDAVKPGQTLLEVLTDKATMEVPAPFAGVIDTLLVQAGEKLAIGQAILQYQEQADANKETVTVRHPSPLSTGERGERLQETKPKPSVADVHTPVRDNGAAPSGTAVKAAPSVRLLARKLGIDLVKVHGSGADGRILIDDLAERVHTTKPRDERNDSRGSPVSDFGKPGTRIKFAGLRRKIAEHMLKAKQVIPHYGYVDECDVTDLVKLRTSLKAPFAAKGVKLTYLAFFVKAAAAALKEAPIVNASLDEGAGEIVLHDHYHVGIAVAAPAGLIVPVVRDADKKSLLDIARDIERLSNDARTGKTRLEDLKGGTFTITSIGNLGGLFSTPIINHPEVGILGIGKIVQRPLYDEHGQLKPADMVYLSFSFDHRVLDGAIGAAFGNAVIKQLQNPAALLVNE